jgi:PAS domain S-box-containing protein
MPSGSGPGSHLKRLRESHQRYRTLFEAAHDAIFVMRGDRFVEWNPRTLVVFGCRNEDLAGRSPVDFSPEHQPDGSRSSEKAARLIDAALAGDCPRFEWLHCRADGSPFAAEVSLNRLDLDDGTHLQAIVRDVTDRVAALRALELGERRLSLALEVAEAGVWELELPSGRVTVDSSTLAVLGWEEQPTNVDAWEKRRHPDDAPRVSEAMRACLEGRGDRFVQEYRVRDRDGAWAWVETVGRVVERDADGRPTRLLGAHINTTSRKRAEEEAQRQQQLLLQADKLASIGLMVAGVAHEINNPNNLIMLSADVMGSLWPAIRSAVEASTSSPSPGVDARLDLADAVRQFGTLLGHVATGAVRIQRTVQSLKDFARADSGQLRPGVDIRMVVEAAVLLTTAIVRKSTDRFTVAHADVPSITGNAQKLEQVIINLITNACQALPDRSRPIEVRTSLRTDPARVAITVRDAGCGIARESLQKIFDPFFTTKRDSGGTGLGLSVSYGIVKEHGGEIVFDSAPGAGTTATVLLPVSPSSAHEEAR